MAAEANSDRTLELDLLHVEMKRLMARVSRETSRRDLVAWYLDLSSFWLGTRPPLRRRLLLRTHQWIAERVMSEDRELTAVAQELEPDGALARALEYPLRQSPLRSRARRRRRSRGRFPLRFRTRRSGVRCGWARAPPRRPASSDQPRVVSETYSRLDLRSAKGIRLPVVGLCPLHTI